MRSSITIFMELTAQKGKVTGEKDQRPLEPTRTRDLRSIAEFQPREPRRPVEILRPPSLLCTGDTCAAIQRHLRPAPRGWCCVLCDGAGSAVPSTLHEFSCRLFLLSCEFHEYGYNCHIHQLTNTHYAVVQCDHRLTIPVAERGSGSIDT